METTNFPAKPDPLDPRTPAFLAWSTVENGYQMHASGPLVVYRKRTDEMFYVFSIHRKIAGMLAPLTDEGCMESIAMHQWATLKYRDLNSNVRRALVYRANEGFPSQLVQRLAGAGGGRMVPAPAIDREPFLYRGRRIQYGLPYALMRRVYAGWAEPIREALDGYGELDCPRQSAAKAELATFANDIGSGAVRGWFVEAVCTAFDNASHGYPLTTASCGHAEDPDDTHTDHAGNDYCSRCAEDLREIDGEYYNEDDCYYWESDGEYHVYPEPEEDEDSEEPYSGHILSWGTPANANRLAHFKPALTSPHTDFTMGVELEAECEDSGDFSDAVDECHEHFNADYRYAMFKRDGSLSDSGFEIVTAARLLPDHLKMFGSWTPHETMRSWKPGNCGTHVHIDSRAFSALTLGKFLMFINADHNVPLIKAIAGRHPRDDYKAQSYCAQLGQEVLGDPAKALKSDSNSRYRMVNLCNLSYTEQGRLKVTDASRDCKGDYSTVELRIFRASLKKERHLAQIEFAHAAVIFCRSASWHSLTGDHFKTWLGENADSYKNLARWFGLRVVKVDKRKAKPVAVPEMEAEMA